MLKIPGNMTADRFLDKYWQKCALFMPGAIDKLRPTVSRNELGWLATLDDVAKHAELLKWMLERGTFALPVNF